MKTVFSYSDKFRSQIPFTYNYFSTKFGVFPIQFEGDMHDSLKHVLPFLFIFLDSWPQLFLHQG